MVLQCLRENQLFAKLEKYEFEKSSLAFLGYIIFAQGLQIDSAKVSAILDWPLPKGLKFNQRFHGFANYYRQFHSGFLKNSRNYYGNDQKGAEHVSWSSEAQAAFLKLKKHFYMAPILVHPDPLCLFIHEVDASDIGVGTVLS
ncbi:uncharacterized protein LOC142488257 [Ascaphus truei]|uniref:uncharacterized protein LOC142488257 n=1 Tax=Ascaphus truei TaxID=8439 RepID=UPI003F5A890B